ncbi:thiamine pyrophosphate-dependent enzyme [Streptomyces sp. CB03238]|uniref:thiamine pyrophosphate-dependent enzyme n=1 Tax=Streptomyces sp. CB03238 TaxID=1907777 RepID=UPI000A11A36D|nr:thiamine pyrophosphate-dependent enzyme [Streptomyces sp. CB03238]ORT56586.1 hypothetical protein BKD26_27645 [Streptomyces sp. CB03238]
MTPSADGTPPRRTVAQALADFVHDTLNCDRIFTVPGEAVLPLVSLAGEMGVDLVPMRHESGAGFAALADSWLTGRPAVVAVNRSPGAANLGIALDVTRCDRTPVLVVVGTSRRDQDRRTGYQSLDPEAQLGGLAHVITITGGPQLPKLLAEAAELLRAPLPATVVFSVPQDVWEEEVPAPDGPSDVPSSRLSPAPRTDDGADRAVAERVREALLAAERPVVVAGRLLRGEDGAGPGEALDRFARQALVPVLLGNKQQDLMDNAAPGYAGDVHQGTHPETRARLEEADLVVFLGELPWEVHLMRWYSDQPLMTVHPDPAGPGERLAADPRRVLALLGGADWAASPQRRAWAEDWRALETRLSEPAPRRYADGLDFTHVVAALDTLLPDDALVCLDAGNFGSWVHRYLKVRARQRLLAVADGAMGFGVPGAVAAVRRHPERTVVALVGDGGVLMTGNELAVPHPAGRGPVVIVADNSGYGAIRTQGARAFPGTDVAAELVSPDFTLWARAFGVPAECVTTEAEVLPALRRALASDRGYLLHVPISPLAAHANFDMPGATGPAPARGKDTACPTP